MPHGFEMTKKNPVYLTVLLVALSIVITFQTTFLMTEGYKDHDSDQRDEASSGASEVIADSTYKKLKELASIYAALFPDDIDEELVEKYLISALIQSVGDDFGVYYDAESFAERLDSISGKYKGIGVTVEYDSDLGHIVIASVIHDSPAESAGILAGDRITHVGEGEERKSVLEIGYNNAVNMIRGEQGTYAKITILRGDESIDFSVKRDEVTNQTVFFRMYSKDSRIAVIRISQFEKTTPEQFEAALAEAKNAGAQAYVFDVRSNPGGELNAVASVLDMLLPEGPIIRLQYKDSSKNAQINSGAECIKAPMAVLCNGSTASAGELFSAALKDYEIATLVGVKTFGKGTMQNLLTLSDGSGLAITTAYYLPPFSENYHGVGVCPDIELDISSELKNMAVSKYTDENDNQLHAAIDVLLPQING